MTETAFEVQAISVEALKQGDRAEFARLVDIFSPHIYRLGLKMTGNELDAEDVLQETFLKILRGVRSFEARSSLSTWIYRIAMNEALMVLRKRKVVMLPIDPDPEDELDKPVEIVDWCCLPENELMDSEAKLFMQSAVQALSPALRAVFILRDLEGLSVRDTSEALGISEAAVKTRLLRARLKLREDLSQYYRERMN